jgi:superkiller protein 3
VEGTWILVPLGADGEPLPILTPEEAAAKKAAVDLYNAGAQAFNAGDLELAAAKFDAALAQDPDLVEAYEIAAALNEKLENYDRAIELADNILGREPENARALSVRYDSLNALGDAAKTDAALDTLIASAPSEDTARRVYNRGLAHAKSGDVEGSIPRLQQAVALAPDLAPAWGLLGDLEIARGDYQRAIECGDRLLEIEGSAERGLSLRHRAFEAMGDEAAAAEALKALAALTPDAVMHSLFERGNDLFDHNEPEAAAKIYRQVLDLEPDNAQAHYKLGLALLSAEDTAGARSHLERFLELAPDDPEAQSARDMLSYLK